jgi:surface antigen
VHTYFEYNLNKLGIICSLQKGSCPVMNFKRVSFSILFVVIVILIVANPAYSQNQMTSGQQYSYWDFSRWSESPEYTTFNPLPAKGRNCTWYAHGRLMQLGFCKIALDSMLGNAGTWQDTAARGTLVTQVPQVGSIAFWRNNAPCASAKGHVAVVEAVEPSGAIRISESHASGVSYQERPISPGERCWPTSFIIVPRGQDPSNAFAPGIKARTTVSNVNFRQAGVNSAVRRLPKGTVVLIKDHSSNGIYSSPGGTYHYFWYVEVIINQETLRGWIAEDYLEAILPDPPVLLSPENMSKRMESLTHFRWEPAANANRYILEIIRIHDKHPLFKTDIGSDTFYLYDSLPLDGAIYAWRAYAANAAGTGKPSDYFFFTNGSLPPPQLLTPDNNDKLPGPMVAFRWHPVPGATNYRLLMGRANSGEVIIDNDVGNNTSFAKLNMSGDGQEYVWRVVAGNKLSGWSQASETRKFTMVKAGTIPDDKGIPRSSSDLVLLSPENDAIIPGNEVTFEWSKPRFASAYNFQLQKVGEEHTFRQTIRNATSFTYDLLDADGSTYRWKVQARVWWFWSKTSATWEFTNKSDDTERRNKKLDVCEVWTAANSGGYGTTVDKWDISELPAGTLFDIKFDTYQVPDKIIIQYQGDIVYDSGWRGQQRYIDNNPHLYPGGLAGPGQDELEGIFRKGSDDHFILTVYGPESSTKWRYFMKARCLN